MKVFLDMDGVLSDFVGGVSRAHGRPSPYDSPGCEGIFDMEKLWGISLEEFWAPTNNPEFWEGLERTPEADAIVALVVQEFGTDNVAILTAPSLFSGCMGAKRAWVAKHYPFLKKRIIFASAEAKKFVAGPRKILVDDRTENIQGWKKAGGYGVLIPRPWNAEWQRAKDGKTLERVSDLVRYYGNFHHY